MSVNDNFRNSNNSLHSVRYSFKHDVSAFYIAHEMYHHFIRAWIVTIVVGAQWQWHRKWAVTLNGFANFRIISYSFNMKKHSFLHSP